MAPEGSLRRPFRVPRGQDLHTVRTHPKPQSVSDQLQDVTEQRPLNMGPGLPFAVHPHLLHLEPPVGK